MLVQLEQALKTKSDRIPEFIVQPLQECHATISGYKKQAQDRLSKTSKAATTGAELDKLEFTQADVTEKVKEAVLFLGKYQKMAAIL